jgi:hypothetical protein
VTSIYYNGSEFIFLNVKYQLIHKLLFCPLWQHCLLWVPRFFGALWRARAHCKHAEIDPITAACTLRHQVTLGVQQQNSSSSSNPLKVPRAIHLEHLVFAMNKNDPLDIKTAAKNARDNCHSRNLHKLRDTRTFFLNNTHVVIVL